MFIQSTFKYLLSKFRRRKKKIPLLGSVRWIYKLNLKQEFNEKTFNLSIRNSKNKKKFKEAILKAFNLKWINRKYDKMEEKIGNTNKIVNNSLFFIMWKHEQDAFF